MNVPIEVWLRGDNHATTTAIEPTMREPRDWTDEDVRAVIEGMLRAMDRMKYPDAAERPVALRGLSWIVNPYEGGGVVIAIEITLGAVVAGPFEIDGAALHEMVARVLAAPAPTVH